MDKLRLLSEVGFLDPPEGFSHGSLGLFELIVYAEIQNQEPIVPMHVAERLDISPGSMYPAIERLEARDLVEREPAIQGGGSVARTTGPEIGVEK